MELIDLLRKIVEQGGSDLFIIPGSTAMMKLNNQLVPLDTVRLVPDESKRLINIMYELARRTQDVLNRDGDDDFSFSVPDLGRFRCNVYNQRGTLAVTCRVITFSLPDPVQRHIPDVVMSLADFRNGMVLITGTAGSGKSTTLACLIDRINRERSGHIVTIEDPLEFLHSHRKSLVSQREVSTDALSFSRALRAALRQAPDVIMLGEMRDAETIQTAITAAETGHLLFSSLHTVGAANAVDRIVDTFPAGQQQQIRVQLSMVLKAVVSQRLVPCVDGTLYPAFEVMRVTPAIQNMIRENRPHQIENVIAGSADMMSMDAELLRLLRAGKINRNTALAYAMNPDILSKKI